MKKIVFILTAAFILITTQGCNTNGARNEFNEAAEKETIEQHLKSIYSEVEGIANTGGGNTSGLYKKYCSKAFNELRSEVIYWENKAEEMIIELDCWIRAQDWDKLEYEITEIEITDRANATAVVTQTDIVPSILDGVQRYSSYTLVKLVHENNNWFIDDFTDYDIEGELGEHSDCDLFRAGIREYKGE